MSTLKVGAIRGVSGSSDAITVASDGTCTANITNNLSNRNLIINGAMQVNEHSDSNAGVNDTFAVDRFRFKRESTSANFSMTQSTTSPDGFSKSLKVDCTSADTSTASNEFVMVRYAVEAQDLQQLGYGTSGAKPIVLSFYVRSNLTGVYSINCMQKDNSSKIYSRTYTIDSADTWERKTISIPADTSGVINDDNGEGLQFNWSLILGSSYKGGSVSTAWETYANSQFGTQHGVNLGSNTSNEWLITGVQLEVDQTGSGVATDFEHRSFAQELALCQRYYFKIVNGATTSETLGFAGMVWQQNNGSIISIRYPVKMRATPSLEVTNGTQYWRHFSGNDLSNAYVDGSGIVTNVSREFAAEIYANVSANTGAEGRAMFLRGNNVASKMAYGAEL